MDNSSKVCFSSIYSSDNFEGTLCFCWSCTPTTPGDFLPGLFLGSEINPKTSYGIIPHPSSSSSIPFSSPFYITIDEHSPKDFENPSFSLKQKKHPASGWALWPKVTDETSEPSCQTQVLHGLNLVISPTKLHDPFIQTLLPDFFQCGSWSNVSKNTGFFCRTCFGVKVSFPKQKNGNLMMHLVTLMEWWI